MQASSACDEFAKELVNSTIYFHEGSQLPACISEAGVHGRGILERSASKSVD